MATPTEKGSIILETVIFFSVVMVILSIWQGTTTRGLSSRSFKRSLSHGNNRDLHHGLSRKFNQSSNQDYKAFIQSERIQELQETQIQSLKQYEVK